MSKRRLFPLALLVILCLVGFRPAAATPPAGRDEEQALRRRVEEFYTLLQAANWDKAEAYVTKDSKEHYRSQQKKPFPGFRVDSIEVDPEGRSATVRVAVFIFTEFAPGPIPTPRTTRWRRERGKWYVIVPKPDPYALQSLQDAQQQAGSPSGVSPLAEELKFKGHRYGLGWVVPGEIRVARFPFANETDHTVTITQVDTGCECLRVNLEKKDYKPGESGEIAVEFNPAGYQRDYSQTVVVITSPGNRKSFLTVYGYVVPPDAAKTEQGKPPDP